MTTTTASPTPEVISGTVTEYLHRISTSTSEHIAELYTDTATLEDPVGSEPTHGRAAIAAFYRALDGVHTDAELLTLRIAGDTAAFHFRVRTTLPDQVIVVEPIDVMTFDAAGAITSMRAVWSPTDIVSEPQH